jgi:hypothetical protein
MYTIPFASIRLQLISVYTIFPATTRNLLNTLTILKEEIYRKERKQKGNLRKQNKTAPQEDFFFSLPQCCFYLMLFSSVKYRVIPWEIDAATFS